MIKATFGSISENEMFRFQDADHWMMKVSSGFAVALSGKKTGVKVHCDQEVLIADKDLPGEYLAFNC